MTFRSLWRIFFVGVDATLSDADSSSTFLYMVNERHGDRRRTLTGWPIERLTPEDTVEGVIGDESGNALVDLNVSFRYRTSA